MGERTKRVSNWKDLIRFVESTNYNKKTIVLCGWNVNIEEDKTNIKSLVFQTKPVELLLERDIANKNYIRKHEINEAIKKITYSFLGRDAAIVDEAFHRFKKIINLNGFKSKE